MEFKTPNGGSYNPEAGQREPVPAAPSHHQAQTPKKRRVKKPSLPSSKNWWKVLIGVIVVAVVAWLVYSNIHTRNQLNAAKSQSSSQTSTQQLINKVGVLVQLPTGETPTVATVNDASKLKTQQFFAHAQDGDKVLIYSKAGRAVLYRPSTNKIIEYTEVNFTNTPSTSTPNQ